MPLLPKIDPDCVRRGGWRNFTVPSYRQFLWTTTNLNAIILLGILGILGTIAGNRLWPIIRHFLQPGVQLLDPENRRARVSRTEAIKSLWGDVKGAMEDLKSVWGDESTIRQKIKRSAAAMGGNYRHGLRQMNPNIERRFGVLAILNIAFSAFLGIFIPFFLSEGLQGATVVQANETFRSGYDIFDMDPVTDPTVRRRVSQDFKTYVTDRGAWIQTSYCLDLQNSLPLYKVVDFDLTNPIFDNLPYRFLVEKGDANFKALRLSQNTSLQDFAFNTRPGGKSLFHELTCIPASLDMFTTRFNGSFQLRVKDFAPPLYSWDDLSLHDNMILKTSNAIGSGFEAFGPKDKRFNPFAESVLYNSDGQRVIWYQTDVDSSLPWIESHHKHDALRMRMAMATEMVNGRGYGSRLQNFLITLKAAQHSQTPYQPPLDPSDDPIFGTHRTKSNRTSFKYFANRETSAIACTEVFKICVAGRCTDPQVRGDRRYEEFLEEFCPRIMSVWMSTQIDPIYPPRLR